MGKDHGILVWLFKFTGFYLFMEQSPTIAALFKGGHLNVEMKALRHLAIPVLVAQLLMASASFVDTLMSGQAGTDDLAGVGVASALWSVFALLLIGTFMAINPVVSRFRGRGDYESIANFVQQGIWLGLFFSVILILILSANTLYLPVIVEDLEVLSVASGYLDGLAWGMPAIIGFFILKPFSDGMAYTKAQTISAALGLAVNVPANYVLIFGKYGFPELGGAGCGWATALSFWVMLLAMLFFIRSQPALTKVPLFDRLHRPDIEKSIYLLKLGLPIALSITIEGSCFALVTVFIAGLPSIEIAGHQIAMNISYLGYTVPLSISTAVTIRVAAHLGAGSPLDAKRAGVAGVVLALMVVSVLALCILLFRGNLADLYSNDPEVISIAAMLLVFSVGFKMMDAIAAPLQGALRGYHDVNFTLVTAIVAYWGVCLPLGYVLGLTNWWLPAMGAKGYWIGLVCGGCVSAILLVVRYRKVSRLNSVV